MSRWKSIKVQVRLLRRWLRDVRQGVRRKMARTTPGAFAVFEHSLSLTHSIRQTASVENKRINIGLACNSISRAIVYPGEIFSFWKIVGRPSARRGFLPSRNIVGGKLVEDVGGGLCQVSGMLYQLALKAGLEISERHAHSVDIYREDERFAPLGADATVVFAYKDFRFVNLYTFPVRFSFELTASSFTGHLSSPEAIPEREIHYRRRQEGDLELVETIQTSGYGENILAISRYAKWNGHSPLYTALSIFCSLLS